MPLSTPTRPFEALPVDTDRRWWAPLAELRPEVAAPLPDPGEPFRVAFVGQRTYFEVCSQLAATEVIEPTFVEHRAGADPDALRRHLDTVDPHVVVVFRPEIVAAGSLRDLPALTLGFLTEPLPRGGASAGGPAGDPHPDLERRLQDLALVDPEQFDRVIAFDPHIVDSTARYLPIWRSQPLPVADEIFSHRLEPFDEARALFVGRSTAHREAWLIGPKHLYDVMHIEHGVFGTALAETARQFLVAINVHNEPYPSFENRVALHLAVGNLVISETLSPANGLDPGLDFFEAADPDDLVSFLGLVDDDPTGFEWMRLRGRQKAESFRASRVYARLLVDLLWDVARFGRRPI